MIIKAESHLDEIIHFGVKGMRWGVKKQRRTGDNPRYSASKRAEDELAFGENGVKRINDRMNNGKTHKQASDREIARSVVKTLLIAAVAIQATNAIITTQGPKIASTIHNRAETRRGASVARNVLGPSNRINSKSRRGVYNVTTL